MTERTDSQLSSSPQPSTLQPNSESPSQPATLPTLSPAAEWLFNELGQTIVYAKGQSWLSYCVGGKHNVKANAYELQKHSQRLLGVRALSAKAATPATYGELEMYLDLISKMALAHEQGQKQIEDGDYDPKGEVETFLRVNQFHWNSSHQQYFTIAKGNSYVWWSDEELIDELLMREKKKGRRDVYLSALRNIKHQRKITEFTEMWSRISYRPECADAAIEIIGDLFDFFEIELLEVNLVMMQHWLWQLKRTVCGRSKGSYPIMIIFSGLGSIGKSSTLSRGLGSVLNGMVDECSIDGLANVHDARALMSGCYVLELAEMDKGELDMYEIATLLKRRIDHEKISSRTFQHQTKSSVKVSCVLAGTINPRLSEVIYDETGMRRFWEFHCQTQKRLSKERIEELQKIFDRFTTMLQGINENDDHGYWLPGTPVGDKIVAIQSGIVRQDYYEFYLAEKDKYPVGKTDALFQGEVLQQCPFTSEYKAFMTWCTSGNIKTKRNIASVAQYIERHYFCKVTKSGGGFGTMYWVSRKMRLEKMQEVSAVTKTMHKGETGVLREQTGP